MKIVLATAGSLAVANLAATAMLAGLAVGTASTARADTTMSGHYIGTETNPQNGQVTNTDWDFTPCGDGCAQATIQGATGGGQARLVNGQWTMQAQTDITCSDGRIIPQGVNATYTWDPNTLAGTAQKTLITQGCFNPSGFSWTGNVQFRQAP